MKKLYSLIKACMSSDMNLFKVKAKKNNKTSNLVLMAFISLCFMLAIWTYANMLFEKMAPLNMQFIVLSIFAFLISIITIIEGIYKTGPLIFNCKDDQLLLSLPIKRRTVLFVRIFKFYVFELLFSALFIIPLAIAYIRWGTIDWTFFLTNIIAILILPIIPIVISCIIGAITSSIASRFRSKNFIQIVLSMLMLSLVFYTSFNLENIFNYITKHATSINVLITKLYYPAGAYANLIVNFNIKDLLLFIAINVGIFAVTIFILSKFYFKINSRLKKVTNTKKVRVDNLSIKPNSKRFALIKKELNTYFKTPVFIINSGFALVLFVIATIVIAIKYDSIVSLLTDPNTIGMSRSMIDNNSSIFIFALITVTAFMTSITNSVISLEGRNINILKSLPIKTKTILMSKIYSSLILTTPILLIGDIILFIKIKTSIIDMLLLIMLSILMPLVSHFIGIIINLKYPKLDAENEAEVIKQSTSSFLSVMLGMILIGITAIVITHVVGVLSSTLILFLATILYIIINIILYLYLTNKGTKKFNSLTV